MARYKGIFKASANYEPQVAAPFDARSLVEAKSDLLKEETWKQTNGSIWTYVGMIVSVASDIDVTKNGVYMLIDKDWSLESSWQKMATVDQIADLLDKIENIEVSGGGSLDVEVNTEEELPEIGDENTTYYITENQSIQRWDEETDSYITYGGGSAPDIKIINGGNANGND